MQKRVFALRVALSTAIFLFALPPGFAQTASDAERLIAQGHAPAWAYAQRGYARRQHNDLKGAIADFDAALAGTGLTVRARADLAYAHTEAAATLAEREGHLQRAVAGYRKFLRAQPKNADAWFKLGYLLLKDKQKVEGAQALTRGLAIRPVSTTYLDAASAIAAVNAPLASAQYRAGLDRWLSGDPSTAARPAGDVERLRNEIEQTDASIATSIALGGIDGRPGVAGGTNSSGGFETRLRFDGRYLPAITGVEAVFRGLTDKDANGERETDVAAGLRYRPIEGLNFYIGGQADHFFQPRSETEFVATWGLGFGADPYPYAAGWKPYWDAATFGSWRTADRRVLEDLHGNAGMLYALRSPVRAALGPALLAVAAYDNQATTPLAAGIGPTVLSYIWLGGDKYRSYDTLLTVQAGYLFGVGRDRRESGWRAQVTLAF